MEVIMNAYGLKNVRMWTSGVEVEQEAINQIRNMSDLPILAGHIAIMPDVHFGMGATVGSVIPTKAAIIPSSVGVDVGCGMLAAKTNLVASDLPEPLSGIRAQIERDVPVGFACHERDPRFEGPYVDQLRLRSKALYARYEKLAIMEMLKTLNHRRVWQQIGTLGGGNHFIEICLDENQAVWIMLHSGSRNVGKTIGEASISMAKEVAHRKERALADRNLAWLDEGTVEFDTYVEALGWAQDYARLNRDVMLHLVVEAMRRLIPQLVVLGEVVNCHHNYANVEEHFGERVWLTRKGAVSARDGQLGIIPGSMGKRSYIVRGKGNADSYCSCSHGAGRKMSRTAASKLFTAADLAAQTEGVECRKDVGVVDEIPAAYKDIEAVMAAQVDLVDVVHTLKQVLCVKG
jgi:tRNA-splicing ligase RtcB